MDKKQVKHEEERYAAPAMNVSAIAVRRVMATSGGEYFFEDNGLDGTGNDY